MAATAAMMALSSRPAVQDITSKSSFKPLRASVAPRTVLKVSRTVTCSAERQEGSKTGAALAAAALAAAITFGQVDAAQADIAGLTPCAESKAFAKRQKNEVKTLSKRLKQYEEGSAPALALQATIERTEKRFANYAKTGLLCGTDGLPHLISDPGYALRYGHAGEVFIPTIGFLYVAGYIGYVGRKYILQAKEATKPTEKEIIIDVPAALKLAFSGFTWPIQVIQELRNGTLTQDDANITVSPR